MPDLIVRATGIEKTYDTGTVKVNALRGVDLTVARGEMVAIMGPSGCGKTTMLNCLSGLDDIDAGEVVIDGVVLHDLPDDERSDYRSRSMGFVFQLYNLLPVLSAIENVEMPLLLSGVNASNARRRRWKCWTKWVWPTAPGTCPPSFREDSASGSPSPGR